VFWPLPLDTKVLGHVLLQKWGWVLTKAPFIHEHAYMHIL